MSKRTRTLIAANVLILFFSVVFVSAMARMASAQAWTTYDASLGTVCGDLGCGGSPSLKPGYLIALRDSLERKLFVGITSNGVVFDPTTCCFCPAASSEIPFDTTDGFHLYRIEVNQGVARLLIDAVEYASEDVANFIPALAEPDLVLFGDASHLGAHGSRLTLFRYTSDPSALASVVPAFSPLGSAVFVLLLVVSGIFVARNRLWDHE